MARRQSVVSEGSDFEVDPSADWEPVKPIHDVLNRRSKWIKECVPSVHKMGNLACKKSPAGKVFPLNLHKMQLNLYWVHNNKSNNNQKQCDYHGMLKTSSAAFADPVQL